MTIGELLQSQLPYLGLDLFFFLRPPVEFKGSGFRWLSIRHANQLLPARSVADWTRNRPWRWAGGWWAAAGCIGSRGGSRRSVGRRLASSQDRTVGILGLRFWLRRRDAGRRCLWRGWGRSRLTSATMQNGTIVARIGASSRRWLTLGTFGRWSLRRLRSGLPPAPGYPNIVLHLRVIDGYKSHNHPSFLDFINDAIFHRHGPGTALVDAGILKSSVVEDGNGRENGRHLASGITGDFDQARGPKPVRAATLRRGGHCRGPDTNQQRCNPSLNDAATI